MKDEPDIVKELREVEKLGIPAAKSQRSYEELETPEEVCEDMPDKSITVFGEDVKRKTREDNTSYDEDEKTLWTNDDKRRLIVEYTSDLIALTTFKLNTTFTYVSPSYKKTLGYEPEDLIGKPCFDFIHPDDKKKLLPLLKRYVSAKAKGFLTGKDLETSSIIEYRIKDKSGNWHYLESTANFMGNELLFISKDITERKRMTEEIVKLSKFPSENRNPVLRIAKDNTIIYANQASAPLLKEWSCETGNPLPEDLHSVTDDAIDSGSNKDVEVVCGDIIYSLTFTPAEGKDYVNVYGLDITDRKKAEEELWKTRDYLDKLIQYANAPIIVWNSALRITRFNQAFERFTGYKADEVIGKELRILFPKANQGESLDKIKYTLRGEHWESVEIAILCKDGDTHIALWNSANVYAEDGKTLLATIAQGMDITERKQAEREIKYLKEYNENILESNPNSIIVVKGNQMEYVNNSFISTFGKTKNDYISKDLKEAMPSELIPVFEELLQDYDKIKGYRSAV